ncbi:MAG: PD40 domain-containing protein, partial [Bacteroidales bacterium]|nr:PD40 domain-containing protein [Bacteroidales bacterium]
LGENINSEYNEYFPCMTADGIFLLFTRLIPDERARTGNQEDFFISRFDGAVWMPAQPVGSPINTLHNEGAPTLSVDGNQLIFTACKGWNGYGPGREGYGRCDLFLSNRAGTSWSEPRNLGPPVNTSHWESQPSLASDGMTLYYVSNRSGGYNIWRVGKDPAGLWGDPEMLGERINTPGDESSVFIHPDNRTLYFSSDGHPGMGGMDIFLSRKDTAGNWSDPVNLGYPINTRFDENSLMVSADGTKAFFASDREGGGGGLDIYSFNLYKEIRPVPVTYVKGRVYDKETGLHLQARFRLSDLGSGSLAAESVSNPSTGEFLVCLNTQRRYALNVDKDGYLFYSEHFNLTGENPREDPFLMNIPLQPVRSGERTILKNVFFETDSYELLYDSRAELNRLVEFMKTNPRIKIEISGYTDDTGESGYNQLLSENRARSVYGYLLEQGVPPERLSFAGFGENYPVDTNKTEEGRANNRRTEFKITGTTDAQ